MWKTLRLYLGLGSKAEYAESGDGSPPATIPAWWVAIGSFLSVFVVLIVFDDASLVVQVLLIVAFMLVAELLFFFISRVRAARAK